MITRLPKQPLLLGVGIVMLSNLVALGGVAYNRSGEPDSVINLTQRELVLPYRYQHGFDKDNSGLSLEIEWRTIDSDKLDSRYYWQAPHWLDRKKLTELGFDVSTSPETLQGRRAYDRTLPREVILVLEFDGAAHKNAVERLQAELALAEKEQEEHSDNVEHKKHYAAVKRRLTAELNVRSRLFVIDAGQDRRALRAKYPLHNQYILARGQIRIRHFMTKDQEYYLMGMITRLSIGQINVPLEYRDAVLGGSANGSARARKQESPKFIARVSYGQRLEPWLMAVESVKVDE